MLFLSTSTNIIVECQLEFYYATIVFNDVHSYKYDKERCIDYPISAYYCS